MKKNIKIQIQQNHQMAHKRPLIIFFEHWCKLNVYETVEHMHECEIIIMIFSMVISI